MGLTSTFNRNIWAKEYLLRAAFHLAPPVIAPRLSTAVCDLWQSAVIRQWRDCDGAEAVIGAVADRVVAFAKKRGARVLGHPVTAHPHVVSSLLGRAYGTLGLDPQRGSVPDHERRLAEIACCDGLIADSAFVARSFVQHGVPPDRISIIRPGVERTRFQARMPEEIDRETFRVVCVGIITPRKAQHLLLRAWQRLKLPNAELVLVGSLGRDASAVLRGYEDCFTHRPHVDNAALRALLVRASAFVLPSVEDGFAQAPLEAMACGLPPIVTENVGMSDGITDGTDGFVIPAFDADAIAEKIEALYVDRGLANSMGQAAAATAHASGSWAHYADRVIARHRSLVVQTSASTREAA